MTASMAATFSPDDEIFGRPLRFKLPVFHGMMLPIFLMIYFTVDALTDRRCNSLNALMVSSMDRWFVRKRRMISVRSSAVSCTIQGCQNCRQNHYCLYAFMVTKSSDVILKCKSEPHTPPEVRNDTAKIEKNYDQSKIGHFFRTRCSFELVRVPDK